MQKHNQWLSNKGYLRHLQVLNKISQRKTHSLNRTCQLKQRPTLNDSREHDADATFIRRDASIRDQQLLWDNYYLGKRIIETPPVISKKKMDQEYKRHKIIIESMAASSSRRTIPTDFRVKKLQEYKENVGHHSQDLAQQIAAHHNNFIRIQIKGLAFYRQKHSLDNLGFVFVYPTKTGKKHKQTCQVFPACELLQRNFYFGITKRLLTSKQALLLQLRNMKGLELFSIGYASFPSGIQLTNYRAQLFHCGKPIGEMDICTSYNKRPY